MAMTLGQFIAERRRNLGLTQEELAERVGLSVRQAEISRLEHDRIVLPRRVRLEQIAVALNVSIGELLLRSGWAGAETIGDRPAEDREDGALRQRNVELEAQADRQQAATQRFEAQAELRQETIAALEGVVIQFRAVLNGIAVPVVAVNPAGVVVFENTAHAIFDTTYSETPALLDAAGFPIAEEAMPLARAARGEHFRMPFTIASAGPGGAFVAQGQPVLADGEGLLGVVTIQAAVPGTGAAEA